jgi:hypothetical protein
MSDMKNLSLLLFAIILASNVWSQSGSTVALKEGPVISVPDTINLGEIDVNSLSDDFGKIQIKVSNTGTKPLILKNVTGCCGTNIKTWPKAPILPQKEGVISVEFRTEFRPQRISRTVTIESNSSVNKLIKIAIVGVVIEKKEKNEITLKIKKVSYDTFFILRNYLEIVSFFETTEPSILFILTIYTPEERLLMLILSLSVTPFDCHTNAPVIL